MIIINYFSLLRLLLKSSECVMCECVMCECVMSECVMLVNVMEGFKSYM